MTEERRPNWLASLVAVCVVLSIAALIQLAVALAGVALQDGLWRQVANGAFLITMIALVNVLSLRLAKTAWGSTGQHEAGVQPSPRILAVAVGATAGLVGYVVALLVMLGSGFMDGDDAALYPSALFAALLGFCLVILWRGRSAGRQ